VVLKIHIEIEAGEKEVAEIVTAITSRTGRNIWERLEKLEKKVDFICDWEGVDEEAEDDHGASEFCQKCGHANLFHECTPGPGNEFTGREKLYTVCREEGCYCGLPEGWDRAPFIKKETVEPSDPENVRETGAIPETCPICKKPLADHLQIGDNIDHPCHLKA